MWRRSAGRFCACLRLGGLAHDSKTQKFLGTSTVFCTKNTEQVLPVNNSDEKPSPEQEKKVQAASKKKLLDIIGEMKVEISTKKTLQTLKAQKFNKEADNLLENTNSASDMFQKATENQVKSSETFDAELVKAVSAVASSLPFDRKRTTSELIELLRKQKEVTSARRKGEATDISNIVTNMKIKKNIPSQGSSRTSKEIQFDEDGQGYQLGKQRLYKRELYSGQRLNIFTCSSETMEVPETVTAPTLWDLELAKEIGAASQQAPQNAFEEMIQWTKEGKLWEFPINNEAGLEDDAEFYEHVFLDKYLVDFPKEGPIRHFMELVTCGLSKNPYLSVKEKVEHIEWFKNYFKEKEELLKETEALPDEALIQIQNPSK
uniref:Small ribosomal subunit protein mS31 n=1 Tax=Salvator merianae TaxID=96440 RepID=A0A8D0B8R8_SALMN